MIILISISAMVSIIVLFLSTIGCIFECTALCHWPARIGWGGLIFAMLTICGKTTERTLKEIVPAILERLSLFITTSKSTTRTVISSGQKRILQNFINIGIVIISVFITYSGLSEGLGPPQVKEGEIKIKGLNPDLEGFRIVQISDLHISPSTGHNWVEQLVDQINILSPDIIALTGDIVDGDYSQIHKDMAPLVKLNSKYGVFVVTGNHDNMGGVGSWMKGMENLGFIVLQNEHRLISHEHGVILFGGVADFSAPSQSGHESSPRKAMGLNSKADVKILLAHQPESIYEAAQAGFGLQLSGHTHGGLLSPVRWLASLAQPFQSGLYTYENTKIYVSNGTGYWGIPFRLGTPLEISLLKLTSG